MAQLPQQRLERILALALRSQVLEGHQDGRRSPGNLVGHDRAFANLVLAVGCAGKLEALLNAIPDSFLLGRCHPGEPVLTE